MKNVQNKRFPKKIKLQLNVFRPPPKSSINTSDEIPCRLDEIDSVFHHYQANNLLTR